MSKFMNQEIQILEKQIEDQYFIRHIPLSKVRNLNSQKNLHDLRKQQSTNMSENLIMDLKIKLINKKKLEKQKNNLIKQYERLKKGAILAIMQKQDMIQSLKQKYEDYQLYGGQQQLNQLQKQLQKHLNHILQLQNQRQQLREKIQNERNLYMLDIQNKSQMILDLWRQLRIVQQELQKRQIKEATVQLKLRITQEQNQKLIRSVNETKQNFLNLRASYSQSASKKSLKQIQSHFQSYENQFQNKQQQLQNLNIQEISSLELRKSSKENKLLLSPTSSTSTKSHPFGKILKTDNGQSKDQIFYFSKQIQEQKKTHKKQIQNLNKLYTEELQKLKIDIQKNYLELQKPQQKNKKKQEFSKIVELNFDSDSSQQNFMQKNQNTQEQQENKQLNINKIIKNCDQIEDLIIDVKEIEIEPNPNPSLQTDRTNFSKQSFSLGNQSVCSMKQQNSQMQQQIDIKLQQNQQHFENILTKKVCFVVGVITGGSLVALMAKILTVKN